MMRAGCCRMAPEIIENWKVTAQQVTPEQGSVYAPPADTFSATVVVWECLTGQEPYVNASDSTGRMLSSAVLMDAIVGGLRPSTGRISDGVGGVVSERMQTLVGCGWHLEPAARPSVADISAVIKEEIVEYQLLGQVVGEPGGPLVPATQTAVSPTQAATSEFNRRSSGAGAVVIQV